MKEDVYRFTLILLAALVLVLVGYNLAHAQERPIVLDISSRLVVAGIRETEIRVRWRIAPHPDNRKWSFVMNSDAGDFQLSEGSIDADSPVTFPVCTEANPRPCFRTVRQGNYVLEACVYRGKQRFCDRLELEVRPP